MVIGVVVLGVVEAEMEAEADMVMEGVTMQQEEVAIINLFPYMVTSLQKLRSIILMYFKISPLSKRKKFFSLRKIKVG